MGMNELALAEAKVKIIPAHQLSVSRRLSLAKRIIDSRCFCHLRFGAVSALAKCPALDDYSIANYLAETFGAKCAVCGDYYSGYFYTDASETFDGVPVIDPFNEAVCYDCRSRFRSWMDRRHDTYIREIPLLQELDFLRFLCDVLSHTHQRRHWDKKSYADFLKSDERPGRHNEGKSPSDLSLKRKAAPTRKEKREWGKLMRRLAAITDNMPYPNIAWEIVVKIAFDRKAYPSSLNAIGDGRKPSQRRWALDNLCKRKILFHVRKRVDYYTIHPDIWHPSLRDMPLVGNRYWYHMRGRDYVRGSETNHHYEQVNNDGHQLPPGAAQ